MKTLDKGQDKIKKIADGIRLEVLEPAKIQSEKIIEEANHKAAAIIKGAENQAQKLIDNAKQTIEHERNVFQSSLTQSAKQTIETLKQSIEQKLFNDQLEDLVAKQMADPKIIADLIVAIVHAIEKEGVAVDLTAVIPKGVSPQQVNQLLAQDILQKLTGNGVAVGSFGGGAQVKLVGKQLTLDMTDETLVEYLRSYVRKDFRKLIFAS